MERFNVGEKLHYIAADKRTVVEVVYDTLAPAGINREEALIFVEKDNGDLIAIPIAIQEKYLRRIHPPISVNDTEIEATEDDVQESL